MASRRVVVVDDSRTNLAVMGELLQALPNAGARLFASSREALQWSAGHDVDCFVIDYHMPSPNGLEMTQLLRADPKYHEVPIVVVTGESDLDTRTQVLIAGANDFLNKPVRSEELLARLQTLLALHDARRLLALQVEELEQSLVDSEDRMRRHARRLESLWRIANNPSLSGDELVLAMLSEAAASIRPGQAFCGVLGRIEDGYVTLLAIAPWPGMEVPPIGTRAPTQETVVVPQVRAGRTRAWEDLDSLGLPPHQLGWKSAISTQFLVGGATYSMSFAAPVPMSEPFGSDDFEYVEVIGAFFAHQLALSKLESVLRDSEERSRQHAERLEAFSRIVSNTQLDNEEMWLEMLREGGASIRPGMSYRGVLGRIAGKEFVIEGVSEVQGAAPSGLQAGSVIPYAHTIAARLIKAGGGTRSWNESELQALRGSVRHAGEWNSCIGTTFTAGGATYVLGFASLEAAAKDFAEQDVAYIEVLASFFASRLQQNWQFDRIQYQQTHDVLTGVLNRSQFRSRARQLVYETESDRYALVTVDINGLRLVNEAHGHMIGDALLVEVASALRSRARDGELIGRIGGGVFGVFIPSVTSRKKVAERVRDLAKAFAKPFSTGDREGKEFIPLTGAIGYAVAPEDGRDLDMLFSHADTALSEAKRRGRGVSVEYSADLL